MTSISNNVFTDKLVNKYNNTCHITIKKKSVLREKSPNTEFFLFVFSCIRTEYEDFQSKSPYSVQIQENTDQKISVFGQLSRSVADAKSSIYIDFNKDNTKEGSEFKVGDHVRTLKHKNIFAKNYVPNWSEEVFVIKKVKNFVPWTFAISNFNGEEIVGTFYEKELEKANPKEFRVVQKLIKRKRDKLYVKWKDYNNYFNSWIDKQRIFSKIEILCRESES